MSTVEIRETFGAIFGMDQMCAGTAPESLAVGKTLVLVRENEDPVIVTVAAIHHHGKQGKLSDVLGIGLKGPDAHLIQAGDSLTLETS